MKITITQIEATAEDLRASRTIADLFYTTLSNVLFPCGEEETEEQDETHNPRTT